MLAALLILFFVFFTVFFVSEYNPAANANEEEEEQRKTPQMKKLWNLAQTAMRERKPLKAEKALLTILKFDEKNAAAYNRLGILYAKEKHYKEAIECFEIAQSLDNNASSLHNVGLIYLETNKFEKAAMAFAQAIELEGDQPGRYIAYAKALEKLGERHKAADALETAYSLNPTTVVLRHLLELYENAGDIENIEHTRKRIDDLQAERAKAAEPKAKPAKATKASRKAAATARKEARTAAQTARKEARTAAQAARKQAQDARKQAQAAKNQARQAAKIAKKRKII